MWKFLPDCEELMWDYIVVNTQTMRGRFQFDTRFICLKGINVTLPSYGFEVWLPRLCLLITSPGDLILPLLLLSF